MLNYIKYEWLKRWKFFLGGTLTFLVVNVDMMSRLTQKESPNFVSVILIALLFALSAALVLDHIGRVYRSLFTDEGFTELTLPFSGYQLLGAKLLAVAAESVVVMSIVGIAVYIDFMYLVNIVPHWMITSLTWENFFDIFQVLTLVLGSYITFILMIYLSLTLAKSLFASFKHGRLIAFGCFLLLGKVIELLGDLLNTGTHFGANGPNITVAAADWLFLTLLIGVLFTGTAYLLDRKINL